MKIERKKAEVAEVDMTPMIDIVFQLIAFFMVITNFEQTQADERVKLPKDQLAKPAEVKREEEMTLNVGFIRNLEGEKQSDALVFYASEEIPVLQFKDKLLQEARIYKQKGQPVGDVSVIIRADAEVPTGLVQELMKMSQEAGFTKFALSATQITD